MAAFCKPQAGATDGILPRPTWGFYFRQPARAFLNLVRSGSGTIRLPCGVPTRSTNRFAADGQASGAQRGRRLEGLTLRGREPRLQLQVALAALFAFFVGAFAHVVEDYLDREELTRWDVEFSRWLHVHANDTLTSFFKIVTYAGNVAFLALFTVAVAAYFVRRAKINEAVFVLVSALGIEIVNAVLKLLFHRQRPEFAYVHLDTYSFPSGHATGATAIYGVVIYLLVRDRATSTRIMAAVGFAALIVLVAFSRLYLEAHYLSDVLAGCSLGAAWACATLFVYESSRGRFEASRLLRARAMLARWSH
jgi:membrane-associated phospholipid phosphatase